MAIERTMIAHDVGGRVICGDCDYSTSCDEPDWLASNHVNMNPGHEVLTFARSFAVERWANDAEAATAPVGGNVDPVRI